MIGQTALKKPYTLFNLDMIKGAGKSIKYEYIGPTYTQSSVQKWQGAIANGNIIYGIPFSDSRWLKIDTSTDTVTTFGSLSGTAKWTAAARAPNGHIYAVPSGGTTIAKLTQPGEVTTTFGSLVAGSNKYSGAVLAPNGFIYGIPYSGGVICKINPTTDTVTTFGSFGATTNKWYGGVLLGTNIYCVPGRSANILVIDTTNDTTRLIGSFGATASLKWSGAALAPDGNIYFMPYSEQRVLGMRPDETFLEFRFFQYASGVDAALVGNQIYAAPFYFYNSFFDYTRGKYVTSKDLPFVSPANYAGIAAAPNGCLYCPPSTNARVMKIIPP